MRNKRLVQLWIIPLICAVFILGFGILRPSYNWDVIGYVASAYNEPRISALELHEKTFQDIKSTVSETTFHELTSANEYRSAVYSSPTALAEHLPFYSIRVGYISLIRTFSYVFHLSRTFSTVVLSAIFAALSILILPMLGREESKWLAVCLPVVILFAGFREAATLSTPDTMATFVALAALILFIRKNVWMYLPLTLLPFVRTDYIILNGLIFLLLIVRKDWLRSFFAVAPAIVVYILVNKFHNNYGYFKIFTFTLIQISPFPGQLNPASEGAAYLTAYKNGLGSLLSNRHFILYVIAGIYWFKKIRLQGKSEENQKIFITLGFVFFHMLLFPAYFERFFLWTSAALFIFLIEWVESNSSFLLQRLNNLVKPRKN